MNGMSRDVTFTSDEVALAGSLALPGSGPAPGVVLVGGSGATGRDNDTLFPPLRDHLVAAGFAVLSYDKRGVGGSSGDWLDSTMDDLARDVVAALDFLRRQPGVRSDTVGLFGHSEGGWLVLRAAAGRDDLAWVVTNGCPGMTPGAQDRHALANLMRRDGVAPHDLDSALAGYDRLVEAGRRDADFAEAVALLGPDGGGYWADLDERLWTFLKRKQDHDPIPDALRLRCPHLALFGGADQLVPVAQSAHLFSATACHPDRDERATVSTAVFPGGDHRVRLPGGDFATGYLDALTRWITARS